MPLGWIGFALGLSALAVGIGLPAALAVALIMIWALWSDQDEGYKMAKKNQNHPAPPKGGDEEDALSKTASRYLGLDRRPGVRPYWKRRYNKRVRQDKKQVLDVELKDMWGDEQ